MAEKLLELIEKYEEEIRKIDEYLEDRLPSTLSYFVLTTRREEFERFIEELNSMLNTSF